MKGPEKAGEEAVAKPLPVRERRNKQYYEPEEIELQVAFNVALDSSDLLFDGFRFPIFLEEKIGGNKENKGTAVLRNGRKTGFRDSIGLIWMTTIRMLRANLVTSIKSRRCLEDCMYFTIA